jgi:hypothetical protein
VALGGLPQSTHRPWPDAFDSASIALPGRFAWLASAKLTRAREKPIQQPAQRHDPKSARFRKAEPQMILSVGSFHRSFRKTTPDAMPRG